MLRSSTWQPVAIGAFTKIIGITYERLRFCVEWGLDNPIAPQFRRLVVLVIGRTQISPFWTGSGTVGCSARSGLRRSCR